MRLHRSLLWLPIAAGVAAWAAGIWMQWSDERFFERSQISAKAMSNYRQEEFIRWIAVSIASVGTTVASGLAIATRWRGWVASTFKAIALLALWLFSVAAAYWPDQELMAQGWITHPPRLAIYFPTLCGIASLLVFRYLLFAPGDVQRKEENNHGLIKLGIYR